MTFVDTIERLRQWIDEHICQQVWLKLPGDEGSDASYNENYKLVHPATFVMYVPAKDKLPKGVIAPVPSICIQMTESTDSMTEGKTTMQIKLYFSAWDPGLHGQDWFLPKEDTPGAFTKWQDPASMDYYQRSAQGWRDVWNFVDTARRTIENNEFLAECRIVKEDGISYGPLTETDMIPDYSPYWFAWMSFTISRGLIRNPASYLDKL